MALLGFVMNELDVANMPAILRAQRSRLAVAPEPASRRIDVPAFAMRTPVGQRQFAVAAGSAAGQILGREDPHQRLTLHLLGRPPERVPSSGTPVGHDAVGVDRNDGEVDSTLDDVAILVVCDAGPA